MGEQMEADFSLEMSFKDGNEVSVAESGGFFGELTSQLSGLVTKPPAQLEPGQLGELDSYLKQTLEALQGGQLDEEAGAVNEIFQIAALTARLCLGFTQVQHNKPSDAANSEPTLNQLKDIFYVANELFSAASALCLNRKMAVTQTAEIFNYVKSCQQLDIKIFLQASKSFLAILDANRQAVSTFKTHDFVEFLQAAIFSEFLHPTKRTQTAIKVTGFVLRNLATLYASHGPEILAENTENLGKAARFLVDLQAAFWDVSSAKDSEALANAYNQFVTASLQPILLPLLRHESFIPALIEVDFSDLRPVSKAAWLCLVVNIFTVMSEAKTISQNQLVTGLLDSFLRKFCDWAVEDSSTQHWPWPVIGSLKAQTAHELCAYAAAKLVLRSALEEATQFFQLEQILVLGLTGKLVPHMEEPAYPLLSRVLISDTLAFMAKSSQRLAQRYVHLLSDFVARNEPDEAAAVLVPSLLRRIYDLLPDDQKARVIEQALDELVRACPTVASSTKRVSGVYSMTEAFRMLENCVNALMSSKTQQSTALMTVTIRLFAFLTWWTASSPEMLKSCKTMLEKLTFSMWAVLSMVSTSSPVTHPLLVLFAQSVFEASKAAIIGVNQQENSAKFWAAAGQFIEITSLPVTVKQLFVVWLLKVVDTNTLACSPGAQKVLENCLWNGGGDGLEIASLLHGVVLQNLASRLNLAKSGAPSAANAANMLNAKLNPKLRIQAEAFSQQLFCIPFAKLSQKN